MRSATGLVLLFLCVIFVPTVRGEDESSIITVADGVLIGDVVADYGVSLLDELPELGLYRVTKGGDFSADSRILATYSDTFLDARPSYVVATGDVLEADPISASPEEVQNQQSAQNVRIAQAQTLSRGAGVTVAVLDTGVEASHAMLDGRLVAGYDFVDEDAAADDVANGDDTDGDYMLDEAAGHGTHVAGIIATVAPDALIMPLRIFDSNGRGSNFDLARAIIYATDNGANVINLSGNSTDDVPYVQSAIDYATAHGVVIVAAAGLNVHWLSGGI